MAFIRFAPEYQGKRCEVVSREKAQLIQKLLKNPSQASEKDQEYIKHVAKVYLGRSINERILAEKPAVQTHWSELHD